MGDRLLIIAAGMRQANQYARAASLAPTEWQYVNSPHDLACARQGSIVRLCGAYHMRPDWSALQDVAAQRYLKLEVLQ
jgi:hypothetical protein